MSNHKDSTPANDDLDQRERNLQAYEALQREKNLEAEKIANDPSLDDAAKIDALAEARGWFKGDTTHIDAYLSSQLTLNEVVERLAVPIEESYTTADHGVALWQAEQDARHQRTLCSPEEALEMWGPEEEFPEPEDPDSESNSPNTEGQLWDLWYAVLHASKKIRWDDAAAQNKLVDLVKALKARPDPSPPAKMTVALKSNWIWESGTLWSELLMLGPASREACNDSCGFGSGFTPIEQRAWMNIHAFFARLTVRETEDFREYGLSELELALEDPTVGYASGLHHTPPKAERRSCFVKVAAVWVLVAGRHLYPSRVVEEGGGKGEEIALDLDFDLESDVDPDSTNNPDSADDADSDVDMESETDKRFPWSRSEDWTDSRWTYWRRMFEKLSREDVYTEESRELAARAAREIAALQGGQ